MQQQPNSELPKGDATTGAQGELSMRNKGGAPSGYVPRPLTEEVKELRIKLLDLLTTSAPPDEINRCAKTIYDIAQGFERKGELNAALAAYLVALLHPNPPANSPWELITSSVAAQAASRAILLAARHAKSTGNPRETLQRKHPWFSSALFDPVFGLRGNLISILREPSVDIYAMSEQTRADLLSRISVVVEIARDGYPNLFSAVHFSRLKEVARFAISKLEESPMEMGQHAELLTQLQRLAFGSKVEFPRDLHIFRPELSKEDRAAIFGRIELADYLLTDPNKAHAAINHVKGCLAEATTRILMGGYDLEFGVELLQFTLVEVYRAHSIDTIFKISPDIFDAVRIAIDESPRQDRSRIFDSLAQMADIHRSFLNHDNHPSLHMSERFKHIENLIEIYKISQSSGGMTEVSKYLEHLLSFLPQSQSVGSNFDLMAHKQLGQARDFLKRHDYIDFINFARLIAETREIPNHTNLGSNEALARADFLYAPELMRGHFARYFPEEFPNFEESLEVIRLNRQESLATAKLLYQKYFKLITKQDSPLPVLNLSTMPATSAVVNSLGRIARIDLREYRATQDEALINSAVQSATHAFSLMQSLRAEAPTYFNDHAIGIMTFLCDTLRELDHDRYLEPRIQPQETKEIRAAIKRYLAPYGEDGFSDNQVRSP